MAERATILVVDDTESNIDILVDLLHDEYDVSVALDGESALEYLEEERPDAILLDVRMPGIDGFEVCRRIKSQSQLQAIPVIFVSSLTDANERAKGMALGAACFLSKPIDSNEVRNALRTIGF